MGEGEGMGEGRGKEKAFKTLPVTFLIFTKGINLKKKSTQLSFVFGGRLSTNVYQRISVVSGCGV